LLDWWVGVYYEILEPGCITRETLDACDIMLTMFHDRQLILGRSKNGKGTLQYEIDNVGVKFWCEMPKTVDGDKALELIARGDITGCSFIYSTDEKDSENAVSYEKTGEKTEDGEEILLRHVKRIDNVYDFTITPKPAFEQTNVTKRELEDAGIVFDEKPKTPQEPKTIDLAKKREAIREIRERISHTV
jgi:HK97 family phage prohead protease